MRRLLLVGAPRSRNSVGVARRLKGVWRWAPGNRRAGMPRYAQLVMGPAGSGKVRREK